MEDLLEQVDYLEWDNFWRVRNSRTSASGTRWSRRTSYSGRTKGSIRDIFTELARHNLLTKFIKPMILNG